VRFIYLLKMFLGHGEIIHNALIFLKIFKKAKTEQNIQFFLMKCSHFVNCIFFPHPC